MTVRGGHKIRQDVLTARHGMPEPIAAADALEMARAAGVPAADGVTAGDVFACAYRDAAAADAWMAANLEDYGHPALARVTMEDGRVAGILDLRPAGRRARRDAADEGRKQA